MGDTNGRQASQVSSAASSLHGEDAPGEPMPDARDELIATVNGHAPAQDDAEDGDSSVEMDCSVSDASSAPGSLEPHIDLPTHTGAKRKLSDADSDAIDALSEALEEPPKKLKMTTPPADAAPAALQSPATRLPTELWQNIFLYLSPAMLSRCLRVSKTFNMYLTATVAEPASKKDKAKVRVLDSDVLWVQARKQYFPNMPRPLMRYTELQMLQLIGGKRCQFCDRDPVPTMATSPFNAGPGPDGLRMIWPFGIRTCGHCLDYNTMKDTDVLMSSAASLRLGLPYAFRTPDLHFVLGLMQQAPGGIPGHLRVSKVYYNPDIQAILDELEDAEAFGDGAANEWRKGLMSKGQAAIADASRWEKWESQLRFGADIPSVLREYDLASFPRYVAQQQARSMTATAPAVVGIGSAYAPRHGMNGAYNQPPPSQEYYNGYALPLQATNAYPQHSTRQARNPQEVEAARQARRADIERRCLLLDPPLLPQALQHMQTFQATMQITTAMNDSQWEMLLPRILAQREEAELIEHAKAERLAALQATMPVASNQAHMDLRPAKEVYDKDYENAQDSLRKRLALYADEVINGYWHGGIGIDKESAPTFAASVLMHVQQRYAEDKAAGALPTRDDISVNKKPHGQEPFLSLDNMKWVLEAKVRDWTDPHRRELFICSGCDEENKPKWFAFEGLIQHYGAKHTPSFSQGNIVVHWQTAPWPEDPPFHTNPSLWCNSTRLRSYRPPPQGRMRQGNQYEGHGVHGHSNHTGPLLSDNPLFSNNAHQPSHGPGGYANGRSHVQSENHPQQQATSAVPPSYETNYDAQLMKLSSDAHEIWIKLSGVPSMLECVHVQAVIRHFCERFLAQYEHLPNLDLLTDALATNALMRPIKNAQSLACRLCVDAQTDGAAGYKSYALRVANVKLYNTSSLITHFKLAHSAQEQHGLLDWSRDMIELPEAQLISELTQAAGMNDEKLALIAEAFPEVFDGTVPEIGTVKEKLPDVGPDSGLANRLLERLSKKEKPNKKKKKGGQHVANGVGSSTNGTPARDFSGSPMPEAKDDEYDPRRPMFVAAKDEEEDKFDPARFDTDLRPKPAPASTANQPLPFVLDPETLAALSRLQGLTAQPAAASAEVAVKEERSPSVGRSSPAANGHAHAAAPASHAVAPDIASILASLKGVLPPAPVATPTYGSTPQHAPLAPTATYANTPPAAYPTQDRRSSARFAPESPAYQRVSVEPPVHHYEPGQALQAVLARNSHGYDYNHTPVYATPPQQYVVKRSPPRYRYAYDDGIQAHQRVPITYRQEPVQYVQVPSEHGHYAQPQPQYQHQPQYQDERAPPQQQQQRPMYVDEYGRPMELIPIDAAPAPIQYVPHPFELAQQQQQQQYARSAEYQPAEHRQPQQYVYRAEGGQQANAYYQAAGQPIKQEEQYARYPGYEDRGSVPRG